MKNIRAFDRIDVASIPNLSLGVIADTNVLVSASYDLDPSNTEAVEFFDFLSGNQIPIFCNVNVKAEFLEIQRRIIFTEALLDFEFHVDKSKLPRELGRKLVSIRTRASKPLAEGKSPMRLSEPDIKQFKIMMTQVRSKETDLWSVFCEDRIGNKISSVWNETEERLGLNFLSSNKIGRENYFHHSPNWNEALRLMESFGLSSSDAMILNMFFCSRLAAIVTSDWEVAHAVSRSGQTGKIVFCPGSIAGRSDLVPNSSK